MHFEIILIKKTFKVLQTLGPEFLAHYSQFMSQNGTKTLWKNIIHHKYVVR